MTTTTPRIDLEAFVRDYTAHVGGSLVGDPGLRAEIAAAMARLAMGTPVDVFAPNGDRRVFRRQDYL